MNILNLLHRIFTEKSSFSYTTATAITTTTTTHSTTTTTTTYNTFSSENGTDSIYDRIIICKMCYHFYHRVHFVTKSAALLHCGHLLARHHCSSKLKLRNMQETVISLPPCVIYNGVLSSPLNSAIATLTKLYVIQLFLIVSIFQQKRGETSQFVINQTGS